MAGFELYLDAEPLKRAARDAGRSLTELGTTAEKGLHVVTTATDRLTTTAVPSLNTIGATAQRTAQDFARAGDSMQRALGAAGAGTSLASSINGIANALQTANVQGAALASSNALSSVARLGIEFGTIASNSGKLTGTLGTVLGVVSRVSPWLALGSAAVSIGSAFWSSSKASDAAAASIKRQADAIDGLLSKTRQLDYARGLGLGDPRTSVQGIGSTLSTLLSSDRQKFGIGEASGLYGISEIELRQTLARDGIDDALDTQTTRYGTRYARELFTRDEIRYAGERLLRERRAADSVYARSTESSPFAGSEGYGTGDLLRTSTYSPAFSRPEPLRITATDSMHAEQYGRSMQQAQEEAARAQEEALQRSVDMANQLGDALGNALGSAITGAQTARQAIAGLFAQFGQEGLRAATRGLTSAIFGGFGATPAQSGGGSGAGASAEPLT